MLFSAACASVDGWKEVAMWVGRRKWIVAAVLVAAGLLLQGAVAWAVVARFGDVPPSHPFFDDVEWVADAGVTLGCGDGSNYCPTDNVTRQQMAAFLHRLAVNRVVDAATVQGKAPGDLIPGYYTREGYAAASTTGYYTAVASCDAGDIATGGGVQLNANSEDFVLIHSMPHHGGSDLPAGWTPTGWRGEVWLGRDLGGGFWTFRTWVVCADVG